MDLTTKHVTTNAWADGYQEILWCSQGHKCETWACYDSKECGCHIETPEIHKGCVYAVVNDERILRLSPQYSGLAALFDRLEADRVRMQTYGTGDEFVEVES